MGRDKDLEKARKYAIKEWSTKCAGLIWKEAEIVEIGLFFESKEYSVFRIGLLIREFETNFDVKKGKEIEAIHRGIYLKVPAKGSISIAKRDDVNLGLF